MTYECSKCHKEYDISMFYKNVSSKLGHATQCKFCCLDYAKLRRKTKEYQEYQKEYDKKRKNSKERREYQKKYDEERSEQRKEYKRDYYNRYYKENIDKIKNYEVTHRHIRRKWEQEHPKDKLSQNMSKGIYYALKGNKAGQHWEDLVPYNLEQLRQHLESQFTPEMSWNNQGEYWEIDHIIPQCTFKFAKPEDKEFQICWSLMNLRPLEKLANRSRPKNGRDISKEQRDKILNQNIKFVSSSVVD